ncbi:MAG: FtsW/RodA/SpoVE family cell cycle protein [Planctomycetales bacterium]
MSYAASLSSSSSSLRNPPWGLLACILLLMVIGVSAIARGDELDPGIKFHERQMVWITLGLPLIAVCASCNYRPLARWGIWLYAGNLFLLVAVYFFPPINGSQRWIPLGIISYQPSESAKIAFILALADYLRHRENYRRLTGLIVPFLMALVPVALILKEPDLGTSLLFIPVLFGMLFAAGARLRHLVLIGMAGVCLLPALWMAMSAEQKSRVTTVFQQKDGGAAPTGDGYHLHQSKQVLSLGGMWGSQFQGEAIEDPTAYHLPAAHTDFVFCMVGERWGLAGCVLTIGVYLALFGQGLRIASGTQDPFGRLVAVGVVTLLATQTVINSGMTVGLMPVTGLTLPLVSYGGASLLTTCVSLGLLISVHIRRSFETAGEPFLFGD